MPKLTFGKFKIKSIADGTLYRAQVQCGDGEEFLVDGKATTVWESSQSMDGDSAIGQAIYAINTGRIR